MAIEIGAGISPGVAKQLEARKAVIGKTSGRTDEDLLYMNGKTGWVKLSSGVNTLSDDEVAQFRIQKGRKTITGGNAQAEHIFINTHQNQNDFDAFHLPLIDDMLTIYEGPLLGILTSLQLIKTDWIQFVPCDTPNLPDNLIANLLKENKTQKTLVAVPETVDGLQSACLLCHVSTLNNLQDFFNRGGRKIEDWIRQLSFSIVRFHDHSQFININTQEELKKTSL